jgi:hypothetical protein
MARMTRIAKNKTLARKQESESVSLVKDLKPRDPDAQYYGPEPNFLNDQFKGSLGEAFNWYSKFYGSKDAKEFIIAYVEKNKPADILKLVRKAPESEVSTSLGWLSRMSLRGLKMDEGQQARLNAQIDRLVEFVKAEEKSAKKVDAKQEAASPRRNIQEVMRERASEAAAELDAFFDDYHLSGYPKDFDTKSKVMSEFQERNVLPQHVAPHISNWEKIRAEYVELQAGTCDQLNEAYSFMSKTQVKNVIKFIDSIIADLNGYISVKQVAKKPRARKAVPVEKVVAKLKYCKSFKDDAQKIDIVSLHPTKLHNSTEAWVYDTKKRKMHHYVADEYSKCLIVKGNTLIGFDKKQSGMKTLRKPAEQIKALTGSKPAARKYFKEIKAVEAVPNGRFNADMVILKAF